jgi:predicted transcriptional regulator
MDPGAIGKKPGKGRPMNIYSLITPIDEIKSYYENKIYNKCRGPTSVITNLKVMSKKVPLTPSK